ncbi:MAG: DUF1134 domain-containing protein [Sphingomonadaceae bacterium]|nr:DUF1134 domain-containing protein [Sphingomonadaceae bacterium]
MRVTSRLAALTGALAVAVAPASSQGVRTVDPSAPSTSAAASRAADDDLAPPSGGGSYDNGGVPNAASAPPPRHPPADDAQAPDAAPPPSGANKTPDDQTYQEHDVIDAAEGVFGKGAEGLAKLIEKILKDQGRPNAYIAGGEGSGAVVVGLRYGSGLMRHKVEGDRKVYWTGPSVGFDFGGDAAKTFILVYNLYDSQELFRRYPQVQGVAYFVGGFTASYLRRGDVVLIPIHLGVGWRLGANVGYMKFRPKQNWVPF